MHVCMSSGFPGLSSRMSPLCPVTTFPTEGSSSVTSSPYRFRPKLGTTAASPSSGHHPHHHQLHQGNGAASLPNRARANTTGSVDVESSSAGVSPEEVGVEDAEAEALSPHSGSADSDPLGDDDVDADDLIGRRDPGSSSYVSYHASRGKSICSPRKGIRPSGSSHSLFEDAVNLCQKVGFRD